MVTAAGLGGPAERGLIEVYPHPALLSLLGIDKRATYKVGKTSSYWPGMPLAQRLDNIAGYGSPYTPPCAGQSPVSQVFSNHPIRLRRG